jgi:cell wall-associated NlpC family hydrolase
MRLFPTIMFFFFFVATLLMSSCAIKTGSQTPSSISTSSLYEFDRASPGAQTLIADAFALSQQQLTYIYGSAHPKNGGMDCSGTIHYLLQSYGQKEVPRQSDQIYRWVKKQGTFYPVKSRSFHSKEFSHLKPGALLFWTRTYPTKRKQQITHVMLYLGKDKQGHQFMFGASNSRMKKNKNKWRVKVFDFTLPSATSKSRFIGYSCIPNVTCSRS